MSQSSPLAEVAAEIAALEQDSSLLLPESLNEREQAFALLAFLGDLLEEQAGPDAAADAALRARMEALSSRFEAATARLADGVRRSLCAGEPVGPSARPAGPLHRLSRQRSGIPAPELRAGRRPRRALLGLDRPIPEELPRERDMVHLEFSPVSVVLEMVDRLALGLGDLFVDLGAGLGQVVLLYHLLTGTRSGDRAAASYLRRGPRDGCGVRRAGDRVRRCGRAPGRLPPGIRLLPVHAFSRRRAPERARQVARDGRPPWSAHLHVRPLYR